MAKSTKIAKSGKKKAGGPFLAAAIFCEDITQDKDGKLSALRIVDGCNIFLPPDAPKTVPSKTEAIPWELVALITFRAGDGPRKHKLHIVIEDPDGVRQKQAPQKVDFPPGVNAGTNAKIKAKIGIHRAGTYWLDVYLDSALFTRMPFTVTVHRGDAVPAINLNRGNAGQ